MAAEEEPSKQLLPFLQRAAELQNHDRRIAYFCRLHAMETGLKIPTKERTKETNALLLSIMGTLEKDKKAVTLSPDDNMYVEGFAQNVFVKADKIDRAGRADLKTAKTFYAASIFFEVCRQFGPLPQDLEQKQKYAIWKAADIRKAVAEGRSPTPGPPGGDPDEYPSTQGGNTGVESGDFPLPGAGSGGSLGGPTPPPAPAAPAFDEFGLPIVPSGPLRLDSYGSFSKIDAPRDPPKSTQPTYPPGYATTTPPPPAAHTQPSQPTLPSVPSGYQQGPPPPTSPPPQGYNSIQSHPPPSTQPPPFQFPSQGSAHDSIGPAGRYPPPVSDGYHPPPTSYTRGPTPPPPAPYTPYTPAGPDNTFSFPAGGNQYGGQGQTGGVGAGGGGRDSGRGYGASPSAPPMGGGAPLAAAPFSVSYDSSYQVPPGKVAEALKAARFAVSSLAFDDIPTAVSFLERSLKLLTDPEFKE